MDLFPHSPAQCAQGNLTSTFTVYPTILRYATPCGVLCAASFGKGKCKVHRRTGHEGPKEVKRYSSILSLTSALDGAGWSTPRPGRFTSRNTRYPLYRRLGLPQGRSGRVRKISPPTVFDPRTVQFVASRYPGPMFATFTVCSSLSCCPQGLTVP